jgi:hypothetical protein
MKRFLRKTLIWLARIAAILIVFLIILYAEEDWRGARDWVTCQKELQAKGETLDLRQLAPPGKPEDDLSKVPIFAPLYQEEDNPKAPFNQIKVDFSADYSELYPKPSSYLKGEPLDLAAWQKYYRSIPEVHLPVQVGTPAQDVLHVLSRFDPQMNEIDVALSNSNAYWPINYKMPFATPLGGVTKMIRLSQLLQLRAISHLDNHETDLAEKDYLFSFRLNQPLTKGCFLINYLVIGAVRSIDDSILWDGLRRHAWTDAQLREMESTLASTDMIALAADSFRIERASFVEAVKVAQDLDTNIVHRMKAHGLLFIFEYGMIRPQGWWYEDRIAYCEAIQKCLDGMDLSRGTVSSTAFPYHVASGSGDDSRSTNTSIWDKIYIPISAASLSAFDNTGSRIAHAETNRRLARLACRLEEYHIAHGQYPDKLDELPDLPAHLNQEVLSEQPLRYQRKGDGYLLYSIGWNQKDDGGVLARDDREGDWVWPSP